METFGKTIFETISKDIKRYLKELGSDLSVGIKDVERKMGYHLDDFDKRLENNIAANRERSAELSTQIKETQMGVNDIVKRLPPEYSSTSLPGDTFHHLRFLEAEDNKPPFQLDITGDRSKWLSEDEAIIRRLTAPIPSDSIYVSKSLEKITSVGSMSSPQKDRGKSEDRSPTDRKKKDRKSRERGRSKERTRARRRTAPKRHEESSSRERSETRKKSPPPPKHYDSSEGESSDDKSDKSLSLLPPKMEIFRGDSKGPTSLSFITKFHRIAKRRRWSKRKRLDRLFDCLAETALEYANKSKGRTSYSQLTKELGLRFDLREAPVAARQTLHMMRLNDDETLEVYLERVLTIAMGGFKASDNNTVQQLATEAFLRGCKYKEAAALVFSETPQTVQEACKKVKTVLANRNAIFGTKVTFLRKAFTLQEEKRVSDIER